MIGGELGSRKATGRGEGDGLWYDVQEDEKDDPMILHVVLAALLEFFVVAMVWAGR